MKSDYMWARENRQMPLPANFTSPPPRRSFASPGGREYAPINRFRGKFLNANDDPDMLNVGGSLMKMSR